MEAGVSYIGKDLAHEEEMRREWDESATRSR